MNHSPEQMPGMNHDEHAHDDHAGHSMPGMDHSGHDTSHMGHGGHGGHGGHTGHVAMFRRLFWWNLALAIPLVALSPSFARMIGYALPGWAIWAAAAIGTFMFVWGGKPFYTGAVSEIKGGKPGMMMLVTLGISVAFTASWLATLRLIPRSLEFWPELALLVVIMLLGHWLEMKSLASTSSALDSLASLLPDEAERVTDSGTEKVAPADLNVGDVVVVRPGATIPADGEVIEGSAGVDESMITGESKPVHRGEGSHVTAGTVATDSGLRVRVTATGDDTAIAGIDRLVADAQNGSSRAQRLADRAAGWLFWFAVTAAVLTAIVWGIVGTPQQTVSRVITVLVIACPHALGLAIPLVISIATGMAAKRGILVKEREALENLRTVCTVLLDKTGTLTKGEPELLGVRASSSLSDDEVLAFAASAEASSEHPLARAIVAAAEEKGVSAPEASDFHSEPAVGVTARVSGREVRVGGPALLKELGASALPDLGEWEDRGATVLHVAVDSEVVGALALADAIRPESREAIDALHRRGVKVAMVTGDAENVARHVAADLGIDEVHAGVRPEDKAKVVSDLLEQGEKVAFVGDGVNDAPALATATVGVAIGAGTDVAIASAGLILASSDPRGVPTAMRLSDATYRKEVQNLWWAAGYNLLAVPLAAGVLVPVGIPAIPMAIGALLMSASTVIVAFNALTLKNLDLSRG